MILVIGILSLWFCQFLGPVAWYLGASYNRRLADEGYASDQLATVGMALGIVGTVLMGLSLLSVAAVSIAYFALAFLGLVVALIAEAA